jgi:hypothetical protein
MRRLGSMRRTRRNQIDSAALIHQNRSMRRKLLLALLVLALYVLHQDFWWWHEYQPLIFGFLPIGLAYHGLYCLIAAGMMWLLVRFAWPSHLENIEKSEEPPLKPTP